MKVGFRDRLRYLFDNLMSKGPAAQIAALGIFSLVIILLAAALIAGFDIRPEGAPQPLSFFEAAWESLMRTFDAGTMGGDTGWGFRLVMLGVTIGGILIISTLIGVLTAGVEGLVENLRKGRSRVIESGHTVILGWSEQVFSIVSELVEANRNKRRSCIVILGEKDKVEMEDALRERLGKTGRTRLVCRTGSPIEIADLEIVGLATAKVIIIVSPEEGDADSQVIKTMLAITNQSRQRKGAYHIVAEIRDPKNMEVAELVAGREAELVLTGNLVSRVIAQTCRQSGLSIVYTDLLDFAGDEIYFCEEPALVGKTLGEALLMYEDSAVIGMRPRGGAPRLNPPLDTRFQPGDQVIAISADDDTVRLSGRTDLGIDLQAIHNHDSATLRPERTLILGWNWRGPAVINELDNYVPAGSEVTVVADSAAVAEEVEHCCGKLAHQRVTVQKGDTTDRRTLDALAIETYDHVIILCYDTLSAQEADARTLVTLLHLRDIAERFGHPFSIVSEMLDIRNRNLAEVTRADDFIVSDKLISLMLAQVAENRDLNAVLADLFDPQGSEIYLKPAADYVTVGRPVNFYTVVESARRRGQIAIGYRLHDLSDDAERSYGVKLNPPKSAMVTFGERDKVVVIAEE